jgi:hypothetical protein
LIEGIKAKIWSEIETQGFTISSIIAAKKVMKVVSWDFGRTLLAIFQMIKVCRKRIMINWFLKYTTSRTKRAAHHNWDIKLSKQVLLLDRSST